MRRQMVMDPSVANGFLGVTLRPSRAGGLPRIGDKVVVMCVDHHCGELYAGLRMLPIGKCVGIRHRGDQCKVDVEQAVFSKSWTAWYSNSHVQVVSDAWYFAVRAEWIRISTQIQMKRGGVEEISESFTM